MAKEYSHYIDRLQNGQSFDLDWGSNPGIRVWLNSNSNQVVFTSLHSGINEDVISLEDEESITARIDDYVHQGYGEEGQELSRARNEKQAQKERERIGERIRQLREEAGMSHSELAVKSGFLSPSISRIEAGKFSVGLDILAKIAAALGKKIDIV